MTEFGQGMDYQFTPKVEAEAPVPEPTVAEAAPVAADGILAALDAEDLQKLGPEPEDEAYKQLKQAVENKLTETIDRTKQGDHVALATLVKFLQQPGGRESNKINVMTQPHLDRLVIKTLRQNEAAVKGLLKTQIEALPTTPGPENIIAYITHDIDYLNSRGFDVRDLAQSAYDTYRNDVTSERKAAGNNDLGKLGRLSGAYNQPPEVRTSRD